MDITICDTCNHCMNPRQIYTGSIDNKLMVNVDITQVKQVSGPYICKCKNSQRDPVISMLYYIVSAYNMNIDSYSSLVLTDTQGQQIPNHIISNIVLHMDNKYMSDSDISKLLSKIYYINNLISVNNIKDISTNNLHIYCNRPMKLLDGEDKGEINEYYKSESYDCHDYEYRWALNIMESYSTESIQEVTLRDYILLIVGTRTAIKICENVFAKDKFSSLSKSLLNTVYEGHNTMTLGLLLCNEYGISMFDIGKMNIGKVRWFDARIRCSRYNSNLCRDCYMAKTTLGSIRTLPDIIAIGDGGINISI